MRCSASLTLTATAQTLYQILFLFATLLLFWFHVSIADETYVTCLSCPDVSSPSSCQQTMTCGKGEICYTKKYTDHRGLQGFRLGCEDRARCNTFLIAKLLVGKRDVTPAPTDKCYECCEGYVCNGRLCQGGGGGHVSPGLHTTTHLPTASCPTYTCPTTTQQPCPLTNTSTCPDFFIQHKDRCYMFGTWNLNWTNARIYCKSRGADLMSVNSQDGQEFLVKELSLLGAKTIVHFHTGGAYSRSSQKWEWVDRSPVQYTNWYPGLPGTLSHSYDYHIGLINPGHHIDYKTGPWVALTTESRPFICEKQTV